MQNGPFQHFKSSFLFFSPKMTKITDKIFQSRPVTDLVISKKGNLFVCDQHFYHFELLYFRDTIIGRDHAYIVDFKIK